MDKGFIYVLRNEALGTLLKVGYSTKIPEERAKELSGTGVPSPFVVTYYCLTENAKSLEVVVHKALANFRHATNREFFNIDLINVVKNIRSFCRPEFEWSNEILIKSKEGKPLNLTQLNNVVHGISICSRRNVESQTDEMINFCELAHEKGLSHLVESLLYCSNSDCCSFQFITTLERYSEDAMKLRQIAHETIGQFEWFGMVDHGRPNEEWL